LRRLWDGSCTDGGISEVQKLVLTNKDCDVPETEEVPPCARVKIVGRDDRGERNLEEIVKIGVGMKAITVMKRFGRGKYREQNTRRYRRYCPQSQRTILPDEDGAIHLKYLPAMVLFKPEHGTHARFGDIPAGLVPIIPSTTRFTIKTGDNRVFHIKWHRLPMTPAYAFTDYKSQGQIIEYVIVDIGDPPILRPVGVYVALSRSRGRSTIRLLRDFNDKLFTHHPSTDLRLE
jgi:hypothetical protein